MPWLSLALTCSYLESFRHGTADRLAKLFADEIARLLKDKAGGASQYTVGHLAARLAAVAGKMEPSAAVKICTEAANRITGVERDGGFVLECVLKPTGPGAVAGASGVSWPPGSWPRSSPGDIRNRLRAAGIARTRRRCARPPTAACGP